MATIKPAKKSGAGYKTTGPRAAKGKETTVAHKGSVVKRSDSPTVLITAKVETKKASSPKTGVSVHEGRKIARDPRPRVPTAATLRALEELKAGKLTRYADANDLFEKLGVKSGKDKV